MSNKFFLYFGLALFVFLQTNFVIFDEESLLACSFLLLIFSFYTFLKGEVSSVFSSKISSIASIFESNLLSKVSLFQAFSQEQAFILNYNKTYLSILSEFSSIFNTFIHRLNNLTNLLVQFFINQLVSSILKSQLIFRSKFKLYLFINWSNFLIQRDFNNNQLGN